MFNQTPLPNDQDQLAFETQMRLSSSLQLSLGDLDVTPEREGMIQEQISLSMFYSREY